MKILGWELRRYKKPVEIRVNISPSQGLGMTLHDGEDPNVYTKALQSWVDYSGVKGITPFATENYMFLERVYVDAYVEGSLFKFF